jgi:hypothetical protein
MRIFIFTYESRLNISFSYPIIRFKKLFAKKNIKFYISNNSNLIYKKSFDILIIIYRHNLNHDLTKKIINNIRNKNIKIILFEMSDSTGGMAFEFIGKIDLLLKKQIFKDIKIYSNPDLNNKLRIWLKQSELKFPLCPSDKLNKIMVGWNIGMTDLRYFPIKRLGIIANFIKTEQKFYPPSLDRKINIVWRGNMSDNSEYSYQRNKIFNVINNIKCDNIVTGKYVGRRKYLKELLDSKIIVSPFGWGEICYRDFEAFIYGCLLIKPNMSHLTTFPEVYLENETYLPINWEINNLESSIIEIVNNYEEYIPIAKRGQDLFRYCYEDGNGFVNHFENIIEKVYHT